MTMTDETQPPPPPPPPTGEPVADDAPRWSSRRRWVTSIVAVVLLRILAKRLAAEIE